MASGDVVTLSLSASDLADLSASELVAFAGIGVDGLDLTGDAASLALALITELRDAGLAFAASDVITLADGQIYVSDLTVSDIQHLAAWGVSRIDLTEGMSSDPATLSLAQANAFVAAGIVFSATSKVYISASVSDVVALDPGAIATLAALGVDSVIAGGTLPISVAQFEAYFDNGVLIDASIEDVQLVDTGANLAALGISRIAGLADFGIRHLNASDNRVELTEAQIEAFQAAGVSFAAGDELVLSVTSPTLLSLTSGELANAARYGVETIASTAALDASLATLALVEAAGLHFDTGFTARLSDTATNLLVASGTDIDAYTALGVDVIRLADTASAIAGLTTANINTLDGLGVSTIHITDGTVSLSLAKATRFADLAIAFESGDTVIVTASASTFADPDTLDLAGLQSINIDRIDVTDNALTLSLDQANIYLDADIGFVAADEITVKLTLAEAAVLSASESTALLTAGVDTLRIDMTAAQVKALTITQIAALGATGINAIDIDTNTVTLSSAQVAAFGSAGIEFAANDVVSTHSAPTLVNDTATVKEGETATVSVLANDIAHDGLTLGITGATIASGSGAVDVNDDGSLSVIYTGGDIDGAESADVVITYNVSDGIETSSATLTVTFSAVTEDLIGTEGNDQLTGGSAGEIIKGLGGNDTLDGAGGNDRIWGGGGRDRLVGGSGADDLYGGAGKDVFVFGAIADMGTSKKATDEIFDFMHAQGDKIDFDAIDANTKRADDQDFTFIGTKAFHKSAGELRIDSNRSGYFVSGDINGDGKADFFVEIHSGTKLTAGDFLL